MKKWENARQDEPRKENVDVHLNICGATSTRVEKKQQLAAKEILAMESYLQDLVELRKKHIELPWAEAVVRATAKQIAKERGRFMLTYHAFPMDLEVQ